MDAGKLLSSLELQTFLHKAASLAKERPIAVRSFTEQDYMAVTPRDLLLGAAPSLTPAQQLDIGEDAEALRLLERAQEVDNRVALWWRLYYHDAFPLMVPLRKWYKASEELDVGAVVMVWYASKLAKDRYRLGRVVKVKEGRDGLISTATVALRNNRRGGREALMDCKAGITLIELPVQRLILLLPGREQPEEILRDIGARYGVPGVQREDPVVPAAARGVRVRMANEEEEVRCYP